jgi:hypothetical protein
VIRLHEIHCNSLFSFLCVTQFDYDRKAIRKATELFKSQYSFLPSAGLAGEDYIYTCASARFSIQREDRSYLRLADTIFNGYDAIVQRPIMTPMQQLTCC